MWLSLGNRVTCRSCGSQLNFRGRGIEIASLVAAALLASVISREGAGLIENLVVYLGTGFVICWIAWRFVKLELAVPPESSTAKPHGE